MKKQTLKLELDEEMLPFEDIAFLFFHTDEPNYAFADDLNHLYNLNLARTTDMELAGAQWPLFLYHDSLQQLNYYLIERPQGSGNNALHWGLGHKLLLIQGPSAQESAECIYQEFNAPPSAEDTKRNAILNTLMGSFMPVSLYDQNPPATMSKKNAKERAEMEDLFVSILDFLDLNEE
ncbi:MAG: hypothetical protein J5677_03090 [Bacteroidales bacterium]|nr:hypothetical protein [Bacteroidales bacterium]